MPKKYGRKTCQKCGAVDYANNMKRVRIESYSGGSVGINKKGQFTTARGYTRSRHVWRCRDCVGVGGGFSAILGWLMIVFAAVLFFI